MQVSFLVAVAIAGSVGSVARYLLGWCLAASWPELPVPTAVINVVGCLGFGLCWALAEGRWSPLFATAVFVGFFGAFTTFSSFAFECHDLLIERRFLWFALDVVGQNVLGLLGVAAGLGLGAWLRPA